MSLDHKLATDDIHNILEKYDFSKLNHFIDYIGKHNPYNKNIDKISYLMWQEQAIINFPLQYLYSIYIYLYSLEKNCKTFIFATRDCCHLYKIFKKLFPESDSHYFHCSRNMFQTATDKKNKHFYDYCKSIVKDPQKTIFIDLHGTGRRFATYFHKDFKYVPEFIILSSRFKNKEHLNNEFNHIPETLNYDCLIYKSAGSPIEMLNYDLVGTLQNYTKDGPLRDKLEYDKELVIPYHKCIEFITHHLNPANPKTITKHTKSDLHNIIKHIYKYILTDLPIITEKIKHLSRHTKPTF